jgi:hypothetical protein
MSTITRIKGVVDNPDLKILTNEGLVDQTYGKYVNMLADQGYTLDATEKTAVQSFIDTLKANNVDRYIKTCFPFLGNQTNAKAARVPLFGEALFDFADSFDGFSFDGDGRLVGLTRTPACSLKLSDIAQSKTRIGCAYSINKPLTAGSFSINDILSLKKGNSTISEVRYQNGHIAMYFVREAGTDDVAIANEGFTSAQAKQAGTFYYMLYLNNESNNGAYRRWAISPSSDSPKTASSTQDNTKVDFAEADMDATVVETTYTDISALTGLVFFTYMPYLSELNIIMEAWKQLMLSLGKDVNIYS